MKQLYYLVFEAFVDGDGNEVFDFEGFYDSLEKAVESIPDGSRYWEEQIPESYFNDSRWGGTQPITHLIIAGEPNTKINPADRICPAPVKKRVYQECADLDYSFVDHPFKGLLSHCSSIKKPVSLRFYS